MKELLDYTPLFGEWAIQWESGNELERERKKVEKRWMEEAESDILLHMIPKKFKRQGMPKFFKTITQAGPRRPSAPS